MARKDKAAGETIRRLRVQHGGHSPEALAPLICRKGVEAGFSASHVSVSGDTIRLVEAGHEPTPRVKFALALYFDMQPGQIWKHDELFVGRELVAS